MNLEETNKEYLDLKKDIEKEKQYIELKSKEIKNLQADKVIQTAEKIKAERAGDKGAQKNAEDEIKKIDKQIEDLRKEAEKKKNELSKIQEKLDEKIKTVLEDPKTKQAMNEALAKRYDRQIKKYNKEKETAVLEKDSKMKEKDRYEALKKLITEHPALEMNLKGILSAKETIKKLNDELATLDYTKDAARIAEIQGKDMKEALDKLDKNKEPLMNYINKNRINIKYEDIEKMADSGIGLDDTITGLKEDIKGYNKKIKGYDKSIHNYTVALENVKGELGEAGRPAPTTPPTTGNKPKWYEFGKRFKNWIEQKKQPKLPNPPPKRTDTMRDALKYDVVRDLVGYDNKTKGKNQQVINHEFGTMEKQQLHEATGRKKEEPEGPEL